MFIEFCDIFPLNNEIFCFDNFIIENQQNIFYIDSESNNLNQHRRKIFIKVVELISYTILFTITQFLVSSLAFDESLFFLESTSSSENTSL